MSPPEARNPRLTASQQLSIAGAEVRDAICDGAAIVDVTGDGSLTLLACSKSLQRRFALESGVSLALQCPLIFPPPQARQLADHLVAAQADCAEPIELFLPAAGGTIWWVRIIGRLQFSDPGSRRWLLSFLDQSLQRQPAADRSAQERRFSTLIERVNDMVTVVSPAGKVLYRSGGSERLTGFSSADVVGRDVHEFVCAEDHAAFDAAYSKCAAMPSGSESRLELRLLTRAGGMAWFETIIVNALDDPLIGGVVCTCRDIADRKRLEEARRLSERSLLTTFDTAQDLLVVFEAGGAVRQISVRALANVLGYSRSDVLGRNWLEFIHPEDAAIAQRFRDSMPGVDRIGELAVPVTLRVRASDSSWRHFEAVGINLLGDPAVRAYVVSARDVETRMKAERQLRDSEMRYRMLVDLFPGYVQELEVRDGDLYWRWVSEGFEKIYGVDLAEFNRRGGWMTFRHPDDHAASERRIASLKAGLATEGTSRIISADGEMRWIHVINRPLQDPVTREITSILGVAHDLTEERRAQQLLIESGSVAQLGGWELNLRSQTLTWTPSTYALFDTSPEEFSLTLATAFQWYLPQYLPVIEAAVAHSVQHGTPLDVEVEARTAKGANIWLRLSGKVEYANGVAVRMYGAKQNITARKNAERTLRQSEAVLRALTENAPDWLILLDPELNILFANRAVLDQAPAQLIGRNLRHIGLPDDVGFGVSQLSHAVQTGETVVYESHWERPDGTRYYECCAVPVLEGGRVTALSLRATNVSARRAANDALRTQASIIEAMSEGVLLVDARGAIRMSNPALERMFGFGGAALRGSPFSALLADQAGSALLIGREGAYDALCRRADGSEFSVELTTTHAVLSGESMSVVVILDASERRRLERELLDVSSREQQRIGSDLHDGLGQELTGIALLLRGLSRRLASEFPAAVATIDEISALVSHAVEGARSLAQGLSPVNLERGGLDAALRALVSRASALYDIEVVLEHDGPTPPIADGRALHLYRIAQEAITNAVKHGHADHVGVRLAVDSKSVTLQVADNGRGIATARDTARDGMGLRIMEYRARMIGGALSVGSSPGGGVLVRCSCPLAPLAGVQPRLFQ